MACQNVDLTSSPQASCGETPYKVDVQCSEVFIKFGEIETEIEIELGFFSSNIFKKPKLEPRQVGSPTHKFKFQAPEYLAGTLFQVHDYFCAAPERIIGLPQVATRKARIAGGALEEAKFFKKEPWEYFGESSGKNFDASSSKYDDYFVGDKILDGDFGLRKGYVKEAGVLIKLLKEQQSNFEKYFNGKAIRRVDYTNALAVLYAMAASGKLALEEYTHKFKIGDNATNPGTTRKVKMVHNLYVKIVAGELCSTNPTSLADIKLDNKKFTTAGVSHTDKSCLKCVIVLNKTDGSTNDKGVYFSTLSWGKGDPSATFMKAIEDSASCVREDGASGKAGAVIYSDALHTSNRGGPDKPLSQPSSDFVKIYDENETLVKVVTRAQQLRILKMEKEGAFVWSLGATSAGAPITAANIATIYPRIWSNANDVKPVRLAKPGVKSKGSGGFEVSPGVWLFLTPGGNVTSGDIQGSAAQIQFVWPLETLCMLGSDDLTLATLPGTLWNMFGSGIVVIKVDYVQGVKDIIATVGWWDKMQQAQARMREFKTKIELIQAKFMQYQQQLVNAFTKQDLANYDKVLNEMKNLATDFYNLTKVKIDFTTADLTRNALESYLDAKGRIQNPEPLPETPPTAPPPTVTPPDRNDPVPEPPAPNTIANPPASINLPPPAQSLVIPGDSVVSVTPLPFTPEILAPPLDTPQIGSGHLLDVVPSAGTFDQVPGTVDNPSDSFWDGSF